MNEQNLSKTNILINNNSFLNQKNKKIQLFSTPYRNLKLSNIRNYSLTAIDYDTNNINRDDKKYLLTEFKSKKSKNNLLNKESSPKKIKNQKLFKKNKTFLEPFTFFIISNKNNINKNNIKEKYNSFYKNPNINNSKIDINRINSYINTSNSTRTNESKKNRTNYSSKMTQTSASFYSKNNSKENSAKKLELNFENDKSNNIIDLNKIKYIDIHINQILSHVDEIKRKKIEYLLNKRYKNINNELRQDVYKPLIGKFNTNINNNVSFNEVMKNNNIKISREKKVEKNGYNINYVNFKDKLDNLVHKIKVVENNEEFEEFVMSLTNDELNYIINKMNKNILPLLMNKKEKNFVNNNLTHSYNFQNRDKIIQSGKRIKEKEEDNYIKINENCKESFLNILKENKIDNNKNNIENNKYFPKIINNNNKNNYKKIINK